MGRTAQRLNLEDLKKVLWTDVSKLTFFGNKRNMIIKRTFPERMSENFIVSAVNNGGVNVMVLKWGLSLKYWKSIIQYCRSN